ncbi:HupE / UreJ protein [Rhizobium leguminosarum bv. trifolii]|uniref:HupE/UreJ family protein n=1 Tax=Rhizobium leguminosarum TaxID=384 RepID=UPI000E2F5A47|nr:HupE/UreJ family protein [Rhizobium leguminosarum]RFB88443.1 HupE / UreJ protein [Rhizobium leguminosarum bv. trifolii]
MRRAWILSKGFGDLLFGVAVAVLTLVGAACAHEIRPAYLQIDEIAANRYKVVWRTPMLSGMRLPVIIRFSNDVRNVTMPAERDLPDSLVETRVIETDGDGLAGKRVEFVGLQATITDVLVRIHLQDGTVERTMIHPSQPWIDFAATRSPLAAARVYFVSGFQHILLGIDHLLFVFGLLFIVRSRWMLVKTITAFTVAHSITLAVATLGKVEIPALPLNAVIALSILFLGPEIVRVWRGQTSFTIRHPWVVSFAFGLLHGFGFASGLTALGLPQGDIPFTLLMFNLGVEAGQMAFVGLILLLIAALKSIEIRLPRGLELMPAYVVGILGAYWTIDRIAAILGGAA